MHILVLTDEIFPDAVGGVGKSIYNESAAMTRHGHDVTVVVRCPDHTLPHEEVVNEIRIVRLFGIQRSSPFYYFYSFCSVASFAHWLRRNTSSFDVLYIHNPLLVIAAKLSGSHRKVPIAYTFHSSMSQEILIGVYRRKYGVLNPLAWIAAWMVRCVEYNALRLVDAALPRSRFTYRILQELCAASRIPMPLIPLGVDVQKYAPHPQREARERLKLHRDAPIVLTVRRLAHRMGLPNLIAAMVQVKQQHPNVLLLIAGSGSLRGALEEQIRGAGLQGHVRLLGFVSEQDLPMYLSAADLFVLPTELLEGFGLATLEAMSSACPVIGTPIGATPELLAPVDPLLITRDASPEGLAERLCFWLDRKEELPALGVKCRKEVEARYNIELVTSALEERFQSLL